MQKYGVIFWISVGLLFIACIAVGHTVRKHNQMFKDDEDPVPVEDRPALYEDYESEFYKPEI